MLRRFVHGHNQLARSLRDPRFVTAALPTYSTHSCNYAISSLHSRTAATQKSSGSLKWKSPVAVFRVNFSSALNQQQAESEDAESAARYQPKTLPEYTRMLQRCVRSGALEKCMEIYEEMKSEDVKQDTKSYTAIMKAYSREGDTPMVMKLFEDMQQNGVKPDKFVYNTLLFSFSKSGDVAGADGILAKMQKDGIPPDDVTYRCFIAVCAAAKDVAKAKEIFSELLEKVVERDVKDYNAMLNAYAEAVDSDTADEYYKEALKLVEEIKEKELTPNVQTSLAMMRLCGKAGMKEETDKYWEEAKQLDAAPRLTTYDNMFESMVHMAMSDEEMVTNLVSLFKEMKDQKLRPTTLSFEKAFDALAERGILNKALEVLDKLEEKDFATKGIVYASRVRCIERMMEDGLNTPEESVKLATQVFEKTKEPRRQMSSGGHRAWLNICKAASDIENAQECWKDFVSDRRRPDHELIQTMIEMNLKHDKFDDIMPILDYMEEHKIRPLMTEFQLIFENLAKNNDTERAAKVQKKMESAGVQPTEELRSLMSNLQLI